MKKTQTLLAILPCLIAMLLFSVGFSTWTLVAPVEKSAETSFSVSVDSVNRTDKFIEVSAMEMFKYSSLHFVDSEDAPTDKGSVVVTCEVDIDACKEKLGAAWDGYLDVRVDLLYANLCLDSGESYELFAPLSGEYKKSISANFLYGSTSSACQIENYGSFVYATAKINPGTSATGSYSFGIEFVFDIPMNKPDSTTPSNFRHVFGKYLKNKTSDKTDFIATARITSVE